MFSAWKRSAGYEEDLKPAKRLHSIQYPSSWRPMVYWAFTLIAAIGLFFSCASLDSLLAVDGPARCPALLLRSQVHTSIRFACL